jgi:hypothetical protein
VEHYLAERYLSLRGGSFLAADVARVRAEEDRTVRLLHTFYVPDDEICFHLFESESAELVKQASVAAGLELTRVQRVSLA